MADSDDLKLIARKRAYQGFFAVDEFKLTHRRFDGGMSEPITRAVFMTGDAVTVLPYDPERDRVLVVEQFRAGPFARGDTHPWQLEAIAGRIDRGESPEEAARREALEEAGLDLGPLVAVANYYPTPGICNEHIWSFVAPVELPDGVQGVFGQADEAEDIRTHVLSFDALQARMLAGEGANAPLILTVLWLARARTELRSALFGPNRNE